MTTAQEPPPAIKAIAQHLIYILTATTYVAEIWRDNTGDAAAKQLIKRCKSFSRLRLLLKCNPPFSKAQRQLEHVLNQTLFGIVTRLFRLEHVYRTEIELRLLDNRWGETDHLIYVQTHDALQPYEYEYKSCSTSLYGIRPCTFPKYKNKPSAIAQTHCEDLVQRKNLADVFAKISSHCRHYPIYVRDQLNHNRRTAYQNISPTIGEDFELAAIGASFNDAYHCFQTMSLDIQEIHLVLNNNPKFMATQQLRSLHHYTGAILALGDADKPQAFINFIGLINYYGQSR